MYIITGTRLAVYEIDQPEIFLKSVSNKLISVFFSWWLSSNSQKVMIYVNSCKNDLTSRPILCNQTLQNYHYYFSNTLWKSSMHFFLRTMFCCFSILYVFSLPSTEVWANLNAVILFCSEQNSVMSFQRATTLIR